MPFSLRLATNADIEGIAQVSLATGQPPSDSGADGRYVALLLGHGAVAVASSSEEQIIGWAATRPTPVGDMLTDLFVDPRHQGQGIGAALLARLWPDRADRSPRFTFSSRHANAMPLYAKAGLRPIWPLLYLSGEPRRLAPHKTVRANLVGVQDAADAERQLSASSRHADYRYWIEALSGAGLLVYEGARLIAAGAGNEDQLFHLTCGAEHDAVAALTSAVQALGGGQAGVCIPGPHPALSQLLNSRWRIDDYDLAMSTADLTLPTGWAYSPGLA